MKTIAYIDGFNLYYSLFDGHTNMGDRRYKWMNLCTLCDLLLPEAEVVQVRYFTAMAKNSIEDPQQSARQSAYLRALGTLPRLSITLGKFSKAKRQVMLVRPPEGVPARQTAYVRQEKGTDVALACSLLMDAMSDAFEQAVLITNDSDYLLPIQLVREHFGKRIGVVSPDITVSRQMKEYADFGRVLDRGLLARCQFPTVVIDADGRQIHRPPTWSENAGL